MAIEEERYQSNSNSNSSSKVWGIFKLPFLQSTLSNTNNMNNEAGPTSTTNSSTTTTATTTIRVSSVARSLLPTRRRLRLDPSTTLYFPYEPGKQVKSAIKIKNTSKSHVAFKFQTTAPKSCFMRPPGAILAPGESLIATVFKFVEHPENNEKPFLEQRSKVKFKIMSLKVKGPMDYAPEMFDELKDQVAIEQILRVVFLDIEPLCLEAEAELETRKKPLEDNGRSFIGEGLVIDEWKERRERYLARQQDEGVDSA